MRQIRESEKDIKEGRLQDWDKFVKELSLKI